MNQEHLKLVNNLIPLVWKPGFMGSFLGRFLLDDELTNTPDISKRKFLGHNYEWTFNDRLATYLSFNEELDGTDFNKYTDYLKKNYTGIDLHIAAMYLMAKLTQDDYKNYKLAPDETNVAYDRLPNISDEKMSEMVNSSFDYDNFYYPYIKTHDNSNINFINSLNWKNKMFCDFPTEKAWIPALLHLYKLYICKKRYKDDGTLTPDTLRQFQLFTNISYNSTSWNYNYIDNALSNDYTRIDMYDLIFNRNTSQLSTIDSKFLNPVSNSRIELLDIVKGHIEFICNDFFKIPISYNLQFSETKIDSTLVEIYKQHIIK